MRTLPTGMQAHLDSGATTLCWCWRVTRTDGVAIGFTDHDQDVVFDGTTFRHFSGFTAGEVTTTLGLTVDNLDVEGALSSVEITEQDLSAGLYDDAEIELWRVNWQDPAQRVLMRKGNLGEVERDEVFFRAELRGIAHRLQQARGRVYGATCDATLGDARCGVDLEDPAYKGTGTVTSSSEATIHATGLGSFAEGFFSRGRVTFTSGANEGLAFNVRLHTTGSSDAVIHLWEAPVYAVEAGDTFTVTAGCDKRLETCRDKFANVVNFRGFPHIPGNYALTRYALPGKEGTDGSRSQSYF